MPLEQDIKDLVAELKISNALRREDLDFRKQLYANAVSADTATPAAPVDEPPAPKKSTKKAAPELKVVETPAEEPVENVPPVDPVNPDPAPEEEPTPEPTPEPVAEKPAAAETPKVTAEDLRAFCRPLLQAAIGADKVALQGKIKGILKEFNADSAAEVASDDLAKCLARFKEVLG